MMHHTVQPRPQPGPGSWQEKVPVIIQRCLKPEGSTKTVTPYRPAVFKTLQHSLAAIAAAEVSELACQCEKKYSNLFLCSEICLEYYNHYKNFVVRPGP